MSNERFVTLANGVQFPTMGLGVYKAEDGSEVKQAVHTALEAGYRGIDTASVYGNETGVGEALHEAEIPREDITVASKVWNDEQGYEETLAAFERSRQRLGLEVLDMYMIHWPVPGKFQETWRALEKLYQDGHVRAIGVSNFQKHHLEELKETANTMPMLNQVEFHPLLFQKELLDYCQENNIQMQSWRPLTQGELLEHDVVREIASGVRKDPAQVLLRWHLQHGLVTIPKSVTPKRIQKNIDVFDFELTPADMARLDQLHEDRRFGPHPDTFDYEQ
ncbi:diketogulonate reductase-like aldo/keto reductase [Salsuginibacillus halophilus]|uniref:Diketogulonate reductase-like aldo/keto reductase n=2 Tax=Salsuginibacillus halophilus TaxID=517424 RepID=A0A2P8HI55_9BACI|nr:aldo/keto reductase [Salsuginibacillus halophilus]PSL45904.1 diketogulonate reductase-like aldo/keto reductase [Salsuginibacillus halophilus]